MISITLKLFAAYQDALGCPERVMELSEGITVGELCDRICTEYPDLKQWQGLTRFGINLQMVEADTPLSDGDEVVFIPPVNGG
ncbi:MoaD/ThiS family protein [Leptolyngbya cf. ectocarpi LEGE 11479]|uniref:Molybdopterin synthase sulfur carrier subunit n=1 Tax=Leptolyngbya cf. ectocarpi LEGE 11479 TaxID=1828722 RepID=A0A928ZX65_LEPEC|nr:MoaD/ThiS family protein [Leptolyngbya ectocarpi]MBE9069091.1 MoaD/ThiS family protein [Leptolyngbya cf. ectocarpi LEGE 11479]